MFSFQTNRRSLAVLLVLLAAVLPPAISPVSASPSSSALRAAPAMLYGSSHITTMFRWISLGSSFALTSDCNENTGYSIDQIGDRMVSGDFNADGRDDIAMAFNYSSDYFRFHVWLSGVSKPAGWYQSSLFDLNLVEGRFVLGRW